MGCLALIGLLIILGLIIQFWYIGIPMLIIFIAVAIHHETVVIPEKIKQLKKSNLVLIKEGDNSYAVPLKIEEIQEEVQGSTSLNGTPVKIGKKKVLVAIPILKENGDIDIVNSWHDLEKVEIPSAYWISTDKKTSCINGIAPMVKESISVDREMLNLETKYLEITEVATLISSSDIYSSKLDIYERALAQIEALLVKARELNEFYLRMIKEGLIGNKVAEYNLDGISDNLHISFDSKYRQVKEEYQTIKHTAYTYFELISKDKRKV